MKEPISHILSKLLVVFIPLYIVIFGSAMPVIGQDQPISQLRMEEINYVAAGHADLRYLPLFYERTEDRPALQKITDAVNDMSKQPLKYHEEDSWNSFFNSYFTIKLKNGSTIDVSFSGDGPNLSFPGQEPFGVDQKFSSKYISLLDLFRSPKTYESWPGQAVLGKMYHLKGEDVEDVEINFFIGPLRTESGGNNYEGVNGKFFPTKEDLYIGSIAVKSGRYDTTMAIPPFGEALNGKMLPITPGTWSFYTVSSAGGEMTAKLAVTPNPDPLLTVNERLIPAEVPPRVEQGRLLVPLRVLGSALGATIDWDEQSRTVLVNTKKAQLPADLPPKSIQLWINGNKANPEVAPRLYKNQVFVPARFVAESLGVQVQWNQQLKTVNFISNKDLNKKKVE